MKYMVKKLERATTPLEFPKGTKVVYQATREANGKYLATIDGCTTERKCDVAIIDLADYNELDDFITAMTHDTQVCLYQNYFDEQECYPIIVVYENPLAPMFREQECTEE